MIHATRLEPDSKLLQRLRHACRSALERYVDLASHSSGELTRLTPGSIDKLSRANLALLQAKEDQAHEAYLKARAALLKYVLGETVSATIVSEAAGEPAD
jgi:hypothetical protein